MKNYLALTKLIRDTGVVKGDRTGTGTLSTFGGELRFDLTQGFPLVTTKRTHLKSIIHELLWFLKGETNIRYLKENGVNIWDSWIKPETAEYRDLTDEEIGKALCKKLGGTHLSGIAWLDGGLDNPPNPDNLEVVHDVINGEALVFWVKKEVYEPFFTPTTRFPDVIRHIASAYGISCTKLIAGELGPVYGSQWRKWDDTRIVEEKEVQGYVDRGYVNCGELNHGGDWVVRREIDQIANLIEQLKTNPDSRRLIVTAWNPSYVDEQALPPCHSFFQFYTEELTFEERAALGKREGFLVGEDPQGGFTNAGLVLDQIGVPRRRLSCKLTQRSADVFLGVPFNIASYALLTMMVAQVTDMVVGEFIWSGGDVHLYSTHKEQVDLQLSRTPLELPKMKLNSEIKDIFDFTYSDFTLEGYEPCPPISAPVAV